MSSGNQWVGGEFTQDRGTYSLYGFRLTNGTRYTTTAGVQARADAGTLNDAYRYTGSDATTMCYLETTVPKVGGVDGRYVWMVGPTAQGSPWYMGLFMFESIANGETTGSTIFQNMLSDMTVQMGASVGLLVGQHLNPTVERVRFLGSGVGAWAGIASTCGSVYDARIRDCSFAGCRMAWIALRNWIVEIENIWRDIPQRFALRFDGCYVKARNVRMGADSSRRTQRYRRKPMSRSHKMVTMARSMNSMGLIATTKASSCRPWLTSSASVPTLG